MNTNFSVLPFHFYNEKPQSDKWYSYGNQYRLAIPQETFIPFFFPVSSDVEDIFEVRLDPICGGDPYILTDRMASHISLIDLDGKKEIIFSGVGFQGIVNVPKGAYEMAIAVQFENGDIYEYISEPFNLCPITELSGKIWLEWTFKNDLPMPDGVIPGYSSYSYTNRIYIDSEVGMPDYMFTEEGEERNGFFFPFRQLYEKSYKFSFYAPEYICDVLQLARMADSCTIKSAGRDYKVDHIEFNMSWLEQGYFASVDCQFQTDLVTKKIGRAY